MGRLALCVFTHSELQKVKVIYIIICQFTSSTGEDKDRKEKRDSIPLASKQYEPNTIHSKKII
jgi:hypothetical protein